MVTAYGDIASAVDAIRAGAADYLTKPVELAGLVMKAGRSAEQIHLRDRLQQVEAESSSRSRFTLPRPEGVGRAGERGAGDRRAARRPVVILRGERVGKGQAEGGVLRGGRGCRCGVVGGEGPPWRERREDILPLAESILEDLRRELGRKSIELGPAARSRLFGYPFPGNIRELKNILERALVLEAGPELQLEILEQPHPSQGAPARGGADFVISSPPVTVDEIEQRYAGHVLQEREGRRMEAAKALRPQPLLGGIACAFFERLAFRPLPLRVGHDENRTLDGNSKDGNKTHRSGDGELLTGDQQGQYSPGTGDRYRDEYEQSIDEALDCAEDENPDQEQHQRNDDQQPSHRVLELVDFTGPFQVRLGRQADLLLDLPFRVADG